MAMLAAADILKTAAIRELSAPCSAHPQCAFVLEREALS